MLRLKFLKNKYCNEIFYKKKFKIWQNKLINRIPGPKK